MSVSGWLGEPPRRLLDRRVNRRSTLRRRVRPCLEVLEDRTVPAAFNIGNAMTWIAGINTVNQAGGSVAVDQHGQLRTGTPAPAAFQSSSSPAPSVGGSSQGQGTASSADPSLFQALLSLFVDGAALELANLQFEFVDNIDEFGIVPSVTTDAEAKAAAAGVNFDTVLSLAETLGTLTGRNLITAQADIPANLPFAGPFGLPAVAVGAQAALQAVQL